MKISVVLLVIFSMYFKNYKSLYFLLNEGKEKCIYDEIPEEEVINFFFFIQTKLLSFKLGCEIRISINGCISNC